MLLRFCVSNSWWAAAREIVARGHRKGSIRALGDEVMTLLAGVKHRAEEFAIFSDVAYRNQTKGLNEVHCALQWAQNSTAVFIGVKYAVRWSAPGAIEVSDIQVNISSCCFQLFGQGHHSSIRKRYIVDLGLYGDVVPEHSSWSASSVGRLTAMLEKVTPGKWPRLMKDKGKTRNQVTSWLDMDEHWQKKLTESRNKSGEKSGSGNGPKEDTANDDRNTEPTIKLEHEKGERGSMPSKVTTTGAIRRYVRKKWQALANWERNMALAIFPLLLVCLCSIRFCSGRNAKSHQGIPDDVAKEAEPEEKHESALMEATS